MRCGSFSKESPHNLHMIKLPVVSYFFKAITKISTRGLNIDPNEIASIIRHIDEYIGEKILNFLFVHPLI